MSTSGKKNVTLNKISGPNNDIKGIYAVEVTEYVEDGKKNFISEVIKYENADDLEGTYIGKYTPNGTLEIYEGNENEQQYISKLDYAMTQSAVSITPSDLTAEEKVRYNLVTGNRNIDEVPLSNEELKAIYGADYDDAADGGGSTPGGSGIVEHPLIKADFNQDINVNIKGRNARTTYGNYCYPEDIKNDRNQDRIKFTMKYSKGSRITTSTTAGVKIFTRREQKIKGSVTLPIQSGIKDQNSVRWNGSSLNALQAFGAAGALSIFDAAKGGSPIQESVEVASGIFGEASNFLRGTSGSDARTAINVYLAQQAVGAQNLLSRTAGAIVNPNVEMLFDAPALRPFSFQFRMSPRDEDEAAQVRSILAFFKLGMSVKTSSSNIFLKAPNIFDIRYITYNDDNEIDHPSINRIKTCALLAAEVDYTPDNSYMTYDDPRRTMTSYGLTLQFNELDPIYEDDYEDLGFTNSTNTANEIGF